MGAEGLRFLRAGHVANAAVLCRFIINGQGKRDGARVVGREGRGRPVRHVLMHREDGVALAGALVEQLVVVLRIDHLDAWHLDHVDAWKDFGREPLPRVVSQRWMVAVRQHAINHAPLIEGRAEGLGHVGEILPHLLGVDARHEPVVLDLDGRDRGLVEQLSEHDQPVLEEGVALRRRQVRGRARRRRTRATTRPGALCGVLKSGAARALPMSFATRGHEFEQKCAW